MERGKEGGMNISEVIVECHKKAHQLNWCRCAGLEDKWNRRCHVKSRCSREPQFTALYRFGASLRFLYRNVAVSMNSTATGSYLRIWGTNIGTETSVCYLDMSGGGSRVRVCGGRGTNLNWIFVLLLRVGSMVLSVRNWKKYTKNCAGEALLWREGL